jgi:hypothetical protein
MASPFPALKVLKLALRGSSAHPNLGKSVPAKSLPEIRNTAIADKPFAVA